MGKGVCDTAKNSKINFVLSAEAITCSSQMTKRVGGWHSEFVVARELVGHAWDPHDRYRHGTDG